MVYFNPSFTIQHIVELLAGKRGELEALVAEWSEVSHFIEANAAQYFKRNYCGTPDQRLRTKRLTCAGISALTERHLRPQLSPDNDACAILFFFTS
jgi:hypothetical protein